MTPPVLTTSAAAVRITPPVPRAPSKACAIPIPPPCTTPPPRFPSPPVSPPPTPLRQRSVSDETGRESTPLAAVARRLSVDDEMERVENCFRSPTPRVPLGNPHQERIQKLHILCITATKERVTREIIEDLLPDEHLRKILEICPTQDFFNLSLHEQHPICKRALLDAILDAYFWECDQGNLEDAKAYREEIDSFVGTAFTYSKNPLEKLSADLAVYSGSKGKDVEYYMTKLYYLSTLLCCLNPGWDNEKIALYLFENLPLPIQRKIYRALARYCNHYGLETPEAHPMNDGAKTLYGKAALLGKKDLTMTDEQRIAVLIKVGNKLDALLMATREGTVDTSTLPPFPEGCTLEDYSRLLEALRPLFEATPSTSRETGLLLLEEYDPEFKPLVQKLLKSSEAAADGVTITDEIAELEEPYDGIFAAIYQVIIRGNLEDAEKAKVIALLSKLKEPLQVVFDTIFALLTTNITQEERRELALQHLSMLPDSILTELIHTTFRKYGITEEDVEPYQLNTKEGSYYFGRYLFFEDYRRIEPMTLSQRASFFHGIARAWETELLRGKCAKREPCLKDFSYHTCDQILEGYEKTPEASTALAAFEKDLVSASNIARMYGFFASRHTEFNPASRATLVPSAMTEATFSIAGKKRFQVELCALNLSEEGKIPSTSTLYFEVKETDKKRALVVFATITAVAGTGCKDFCMESLEEFVREALEKYNPDDYRSYDIMRAFEHTVLRLHHTYRTEFEPTGEKSGAELHLIGVLDGAIYSLSVGTTTAYLWHYSPSTTTTFMTPLGLNHPLPWPAFAKIRKKGGIIVPTNESGTLCTKDPGRAVAKVQRTSSHLALIGYGGCEMTSDASTAPPAAGAGARLAAPPSESLLVYEPFAMGTEYEGGFKQTDDYRIVLLSPSATRVANPSQIASVLKTLIDEEGSSNTSVTKGLAATLIGNGAGPDLDCMVVHLKHRRSKKPAAEKAKVE